MGNRSGRASATAHLDDEVLGDYQIPGALDAGRHAEVTAHLAGCPTCREALAGLTATVALLDALPQLAPRRSFVLTPEALAASGARARRLMPPRLPRWVWPVRWASALATIFLAIVLTLDSGLNTPATPVAPPSAVTTTVLPAPNSLGVAPTRTPIVPGSGAILGAGGPAPPSRAVEPTQPLESFALPTPELVFPTATAVVTVPVAMPAAPSRERDWFFTELGLAILAVTLAAAGFLLPLLLRRRERATV